AGLGGGVENLELVPVHVVLRVQASLLRRHGRLRLALRGEETFGFERRHAALPGGGYRLAIDVVGHIAGGEYARHRRRSRERRGLDVAAVLHLQLPGENFGAGVWPIAMKTPSARISVEALVLTLRRTTPLTFNGFSSPTTSSSTLSQITEIFGFLN